MAGNVLVPIPRRKHSVRAYPEGSTVGDSDGEVGKDGEEPVRKGRSKGEVMGYLVDRKE